MPQIQLSSTESLLVVAQNRIDLLTGEKVGRLRAEVAELEAAIEEVRAREAKLQRASVQAWDQILEALRENHGEAIPADAQMEADDEDLVSITWEDSPKPSTPTLSPKPSTPTLSPKPSTPTLPEDDQELDVGAEAREWDRSLTEAAAVLDPAAAK